MVEQVEPVVADLGLRASGRRLDLGGDVRPRQAEWIDVAGRPRLVVDGSDDITRLWDPLSRTRRSGWPGPTWAPVRGP